MGARSSVDGRRSVRESFVRRVRRVKEKKNKKERRGKEKGKRGETIAMSRNNPRSLVFSPFLASSATFSSRESRTYLYLNDDGG